MTSFPKVFSSCSENLTLEPGKYENVVILAGNQVFPKPDKSGNETGHIGNGVAIINQLIFFPDPTQSPTPRPLPSFPSILNFSFSSKINNVSVADNHGIFSFQICDSYSSLIRGGKYLFYCNSSFCGKTILAETILRKKGEMTVEVGHDINILFNDDLLLHIPGYGSMDPMFIKKGTNLLYNHNMSEYDCINSNVVSSLTITYTLPRKCSKRICSNDSFFNKICLCFIINYK